MNIVPWLIAIVVEIILLCVMQETVWLGLVILTVAFMLHGWFLHGNVQKRKKRKYIFMEAYCFLWGACMIGLYLADRFLKELDGYEKYAVLIGLGLVFVLYGADRMAERLRCRQEIPAVYQKTARSYPSAKKTFHYSPVFSYDYEGRHYSATAWESFSSEEKIGKKYQKGQEYVVYINSKDPQNFALRRGGDKGAFLIILIGIALICALF